MAADSDLSDPKTYHADDMTVDRVNPRAYRLDACSVGRMGKRCNIFTLTDTSKHGAWMHFVRNMAKRPFKEDTFFTIVVMGDGAVHSLADVIRTTLKDLGAIEIAPLHTLCQSDETNQIKELVEWTNGCLLQGILKEMQALTVEREVLVARTGTPNHVYLPTGVAPIHLACGRGDVFQATVLPQNGDVFMLPPEETTQRVAVKRLDVYTALCLVHLGIPENPFREIFRLIQSQGYGIAPKFIDAIFDGKYLYIITDWASEGSLATFSGKFPGSCLPEAIAQDINAQVFKIFDILHDRLKIVHHDLKPDNILINKVIVNGSELLQVWLTDFAQSLRIPADRMISASRPHSTPAFRLPEHHCGESYNACQYDLWSWEVSLFCVMTGRAYMYTHPSMNCHMYEYTIWAGGLSRFAPNSCTKNVESRIGAEIVITKAHLNAAVFKALWKRTEQNLQRVHSLIVRLKDLRYKQRDLRQLARQIGTLSDNLLDMFEAFFDPNLVPMERPTREQLALMPWISGH